MMYVFVICAVAGGTVMLCQFALTLLGMGGDVAGDSLHHGTDFDAGADGGLPVDHDHTDISELSSDGHHAAWFVNVISFRSIVAAITIFGLAGLAADAAELRPAGQWIIALAMGGAAMYGVAWTLSIMRRLNADGTVRIQRAVGQLATVYVPIGPHPERAGKVQIKLQDRLVELEAVTSADACLPTGSRVRVVGLIGNRLEVEPVPIHEHESVAS